MTTPWPIHKNAQYKVKIERNITTNYEYKVDRQKVGANEWDFAAMEHLKAF